MTKLTEIPYGNQAVAMTALNLAGMTAEEFKSMGTKPGLADRVTEMVRATPDYAWGAPKYYSSVRSLGSWMEVVPGVEIVADAIRPYAVLHVRTSSANGVSVKGFEFRDSHSRWVQVADLVQVRSHPRQGFEVRIYEPVSSVPEKKPVSVLGLSFGVAIDLKAMEVVTLGDLAGWTRTRMYDRGLSLEEISVLVRGLAEYGLRLRTE